MRIRGLVVVALAALLTASCGREAPPPPPAPATVEVSDAIFVLNPDGTATLSAKVHNGTKNTYQLSYVPQANTKGSEFDDIPLRFYDSGTTYLPGKSGTIGDVADQTQIRLAPAPAVGTRVTLDLGFAIIDEEQEELNWVEFGVPLDVPVVDRTIDHLSILGAEPNRKITVEDGKIFVIPGQSRALVDGSIISTITDSAYEIPRANDEQGNLVPYRHHTATGGPYGIFAEKGKTVRISSPPYTVPNGDIDAGDFDYFDAKDVTVGEKITVNIPFQSGDVIAIFTVVAG